MNITLTDINGRINGNGMATIPTGAITVNDEIVSDYKYKDNQNITSVTFGSNVKYIGKQAFYRCYNLTSVDFSGATSLKYIGIEAFGSCNNLTGNIDLSNTQIKFIDEVGFGGISSSYGDQSTTTINLGSCKAMKKDIINGASVMSLTANDLEAIDGWNAFENYYPNATYTLPKLRIVFNGSVGYLYTTSETTTIDLRTMFPALQIYRDTFTFRNGENVTTVYMPEDLRCIAYNPFLNEINSSASIYYFGHPIQVEDNWATDASNKTIYVPNDYLTEWQSDPFWSNYTGHIQGFDPSNL